MGRRGDSHLPAGILRCAFGLIFSPRRCPNSRSVHCRVTPRPGTPGLVPLARGRGADPGRCSGVRFNPSLPVPSPSTAAAAITPSRGCGCSQCRHVCASVRPPPQLLIITRQICSGFNKEDAIRSLLAGRTAPRCRWMCMGVGHGGGGTVPHHRVPDINPSVPSIQLSPTQMEGQLQQPTLPCSLREGEDAVRGNHRDIRAASSSQPR